MKSLIVQCSWFIVHSFRLKRVLFFGFLLLTSYFLIHNSNIYAQTVNYEKLCQEIQNDPPPTDYDDPDFVEPTWDELDEYPYKVTVYDPITLTDTPNSETGKYGGTLKISNLTLPHAKEIADYLEGPFLDESHRKADFRGFKSNSAAFLHYNGPVVELMPQKAQDSIRAGYVYTLFAYGKRLTDNTYKLPDIKLTYWDFCGNNPRTIYDLVQSWDFPKPPTLEENPTEADRKNWLHTWAKYWPKIPLHNPQVCNIFTRECTSYPGGVFGPAHPPNMRAQGCLDIRQPDPGQTGGAAAFGKDCPEQSSPPSLQVVRLGIPDLVRLDTLARFVQQLISPQQIIQIYFCKFAGFASFCEEETTRTDIGDCGVAGPGTEAARLGECAEARGEKGVGGNPIYLYDEAGNKVDSVTVDLTGTGTPGQPVSESIGFASKFPYLGLTFGKLTAEITGAFKYFDPQDILKDADKYQENSTQIPAQTSFFDTTTPSGGTISPVKIWAGFLSGIKKSKDFVICALQPSSEGAAACATQAGL